MNETVHDIVGTVLQMTSLRCTILYCLNCYLVYERDSTWYSENCTTNDFPTLYYTVYCLNCYLVYERDSTWYCEYCTANWRWTSNRRCFQSEPGSHKVIFIYTFFTDNILARKCLSLRKFAALVRLGQPTAHRFSLLINSLINF